MVEEGGGPARKGRQRPGQIELTEADAAPGVGSDQIPGIAPDVQARVRAVSGPGRRALGRHPGAGAQRMLAEAAPPAHQHKGQAVKQRQGGQQAAGGTRQAAVHHGPQQQHAQTQRSGARGSELDGQHHRHAGRPGRSARQPAQLKQQHRGRQAPQQKAAQVVGLAQIAHRPARQARWRDQAAIGPAGRKHLHQRHGGAQQAGGTQSSRKRRHRRGTRPLLRGSRPGQPQQAGPQQQAQGLQCQ